MAIQDDITLVLIFVNIVLTLVLMYVYTKNHRTIGSRFTLGLIFFSLAFLVENIMDFVFYSSMLMQSVVGFTACFFIVNVLEMIGLIVLLWVTWK